MELPPSSFGTHYQKYFFLKYGDGKFLKSGAELKFVGPFLPFKGGLDDGRRNRIFSSNILPLKFKHDRYWPRPVIVPPES